MDLLMGDEYSGLKVDYISKINQPGILRPVTIRQRVTLRQSGDIGRTLQTIRKKMNVKKLS